MPLNRAAFLSAITVGRVSNLDGGIEAVIQKVEDWFRDAVESATPPCYADVGLEHCALG